MFDVFISHSSVDAKTAVAICEFLEKEGLQCWIAPRNVKGGKRYSEEIIDGIKDSQVFLLLYSSSSNKSKHVISELDVAFNSEKIIIPFCLDSEKMSEAFSYYLAATHRIVGYPKPSDRYEELKENIISNIPSLASAREHDRMWENVAKELGISIEDLKRISKKPQHEEGNTSENTRSRYDVLQNDKGEIMLIIQQRKGPVSDSPLFVIDSITKYALLYRSHESTVFFDDIRREVNEALRKVSELQIVEINEDDVVCEYKAPIRIVNDVRSLMDDEIHDDENDLLDNIEPKEKPQTNHEKTEREPDVVCCNNGDIMIIYDGARGSDDVTFVYQDSGDSIFFLNDSYFIVPPKVSANTVTRLDSEDGKVYVHYFKETLDESDERKRLEIADAIDQWEKDGQILPPHTEEVKKFHVTSLLLLLSEMWDSREDDE